MTPNEAHAFNSGIATMISIARRSADALKTDPRHIPIAFAVAALDQLAIDGVALLIRPAGEVAAPAEQPLNPSPTTLAAMAAAE